MDDIILNQDMVEALGFIDPRKYRKTFTVDNEPIYIPIGPTHESSRDQAAATPNEEQRITGKARRKPPDECIYYTADDIAELLGASKSKAYKIIQSLNKKLEKQGYIVQAGRVPKQYFHENYYGMEKGLSEQKE